MNIEYKETITRMVNANHGLMRHDLSLKVMEYVSPQVFSAEIYMTALDDLILDGEIIELPFTTPETIAGKIGVRLNVAYFPKGSRFCVALLNINNDTGCRI